MKDKITGTVYVFGNNIDTDQIYPGKYVEYTEIEDIKKYAIFLLSCSHESFLEMQSISVCQQ